MFFMGCLLNAYSINVFRVTLPYRIITKVMTILSEKSYLVSTYYLVSITGSLCLTGNMNWESDLIKAMKDLRVLHSKRLPDDLLHMMFWSTKISSDKLRKSVDFDSYG